MQKKSASQSGIFNTRVVIAIAFCSVGASLGFLSFASTPSSGTLTNVSGPISYTAGPFFQSNQSPLGLGQLDTGPRCDSADPCDSYTLTVSLPAGYAAAHPNAAVKVTMFWNDTGSGQSNYDLYIYNGINPTVDGNHPADHQSASNANPEVAIINPVIDGNTQYTLEIVPNQPTGETVQVRIELLPGSGGIFPGFGGADPTAPGVPRYQTFVAPPNTSADVGNGEFNIGFNPHTGRIMVMNSGPIWRLTPPEILIPAKPECCEALWEDKDNPTTNLIIGLDPILWTDQKSGRTFSSNSTVGANAVYGYTDNDGDTWTSFGIAAPNGGADHETIGSGPYPALLLSALGTPANQGEAVYYCSQDIVGPAACYRSDTLGTSWGASTLAYNGQGSGVPGGTCGGLHGHIHVAPDGTAWLPVNQCSHLQGGVFSTDGGTTWNTFTIPNAISQQQGADPSIAIDSDSTIYYSYVNNEPVAPGNPPEGHARVVVGHRVGTTVNWTNYVDLGATHGVVNAAEIEAVGGSSGRAAVGFLGTNVNGDYQANSFPGKWYAFIATTYDGGANWTTVNATPNDPVQSMTGIWQQGGGAKDRNLLDFNEITIDDKGRVLYGYSDGCVTTGCIAGASANDFTAYMRVARQSGGKTLLSSYDGNTDIATALAPKPPCLSGTRDTTGSHLTWKVPDNGGSAIVNYLIFRGTTSGSEVQIGQTGVAKNSFDDTSALPNVPDYFYEVKAVNTSSTPVGNFSNEIDLQVAVLPPPQTPCALPGLTILTDPPNDETDMVPGHDVLALSIAEPFAFASDKIVFTLKMQSLATVPPNTEWPITFNVGATNYTVQMTNVAADGATTAPIFQVGPTGGTLVAADPASNFTPDGTITIVVPRSAIGNPALGTQLTQFLVRITIFPGVTPDNMPNGLTPTGTYTVVGNAFCAPNTAPLAALSASPTQGDPPLFVTFTPSGTDADAGDTIASYTIDFGDGSAPVTQSCSATCPQITHTYTTNSDFAVQLKVTDSRGKLSSNTALVDIGVELPLDRVESSKMHGTKGPFPVVLYDRSLYPDGSGEIECRTEGNGYTLIYSFGSCPSGNCEFTVTNTASSTPTVTNGATVASHGPGPGPNQYQVQLTGVTNAQYHFVTLNGVPVHNNTNSGNATLNDVSAQLPLLVGDVNGSKLVDGNDVSAVQAKTRQTVTTTNFRLDVNASGLIDGNDVSLTQSKSRTSLH
jgi:hypothetical protein